MHLCVCVCVECLNKDMEKIKDDSKRKQMFSFSSICENEFEELFKKI